MNWKLIFQLSLFGLAMGIATVFVISSNIEPAFWLPIFLLCAWIIARRCHEKLFLHGVFLGLANSVWITGAHIVWVGIYLAGHPREASMMASGPLLNSPRLMMLLIGPFVGLVSGLVLGLFAMVAGKLVKPSVHVRKASAS